MQSAHVCGDKLYRCITFTITQTGLDCRIDWNRLLWKGYSADNHVKPNLGIICSQYSNSELKHVSQIKKQLQSLTWARCLLWTPGKGLYWWKSVWITHTLFSILSTGTHCPSCCLLQAPRGSELSVTWPWVTLHTLALRGEGPPTAKENI